MRKDGADQILFFFHEEADAVYLPFISAPEIYRGDLPTPEGGIHIGQEAVPMHHLRR